MLTKRNIVKFVKDQVIWSAAASATSAAINTVVDEPTDHQETGIEIGSLAVGYVVMHKLKFRTDQMIDSVADWRQNRKVETTIVPVVE